MYNFPHTYKNGDWTVTINSDGTLVRTSDVEFPKAKFPSSLDIKITDYCNLSSVCTYCHEKSAKEGKHCSIDSLLDVLSDLPAGVELAIGGGDPTSHPQLVEFLSKSKSRGHICNLTVNQLHLSSKAKLLNSLISDYLICGLGVSYRGGSASYHIDPNVLSLYEYPHTVFHFIAGIDDFYTVDNFLRMPIGDSVWFRKKVLILGYKNFGNGVKYAKQEGERVQHRIDKLAIWLPKLFDYGHLSFDNLAIDQLKLRRLFTDSGWSKFYLGDDGTSSMYVDAVNKEFGKSSVDINRVKWLEKDIRDYFSDIS